MYASSVNKKLSGFRISPGEADHHCVTSVWNFTSVDDGVSPDVVLTGIGVEVTFEVSAAAALLRQYDDLLRQSLKNPSLSTHQASSRTICQYSMDEKVGAFEDGREGFN
ncbi:hypothetical protein ARMGADRAFT_1098958 [Armillaria gallica]|uniref:Xylulose 5-phosphate/Fructose 6-phosphate phosphoketolase C-terminal domain-containing protein n=1 Tax=Armillaria gallica TaxID=47427 RepID=A0A2H3DS61_ARMGA|nr:hypothetical protein ARMGADRAFT_1098958 [Armillaria gallica]